MPNPQPEPQTIDAPPVPANPVADSTNANDPFRTVDMAPAASSSQRSRIAVPGYVVQIEIGRGGMGVVYRARQESASRDVALKMLLVGESADTSERARFHGEAEAIARLQHPNIVAIYDVGQHEGHAYFSMELCARGSLAVRANRPAGPREIAGVIVKVARGVGAAHSLGIIHRDLKPGNILITAGGEPKVADFGLAKNLDAVRTRGDGASTLTGAVLGTPSYMAPEQAGSAKHVGPPADVYGLGAILYELLTGVPPFRGNTPAETLLMVVTEDPRPIREFDVAVPRDLETICLKCLEKDPARRYATATELADDLARYLEGEAISGDRGGIVGRLAGAIDRVQPAERLRSHGALLLALAPVMFLPEVWVTIAVAQDWPGVTILMAQLARVIAFILVAGWFRRWQYWPSGPVERQIWVVMLGYIATCSVYGFSRRLVLGFEPGLEVMLYQGLACLAAVSFFSLVSIFWGQCAWMGFAFLGIALVMAIEPRLAPLEFGFTWAVVLIILGLRLRRQ